MSSDWKVGDLAVCVDASPFNCTCGIHNGNNVRIGMRVRVTGVTIDSDCGEIVLLWDRRDYPDGGLARRFHKIRPDEHHACEPEFVTLLKRSKRKVGA